ncbi:hypothetical protein Sm713_50650 [Streptomyces sp. TS71-3]|nr:hypothetical protein Sm713_50650 [Streptomyces sp. TS71-3]
MIEDLSRAARVRTASVVELASELIRRPSRGGIDDYEPVLTVLGNWLAARELPHRRLHDAAGALVGLLVEIPGGRPGSWWTLDACVDTAPYGDEAAWSFPPACGDIVDGWLRGRGGRRTPSSPPRYSATSPPTSPPAPSPCTAGSRCSWTSMSTPAASVAPAPTSPTRARPAPPG